MDLKRTFDILENVRINHQKNDILAGKVNGQWELYSTDRYIKLANRFSYGLMALGLSKGDKIVSISNNRPEWNIIDMGMSQAGVIHVPIYPTSSNEDFEYILKHCEPKMIIISDKLLLDKLKDIIKKVNNTQQVFTFNEIENAQNWSEILKLGKTNEKRFETDLKITKGSIKTSDVVTIIYTSGTTGNPKGVMLSHENIISNVKAVQNIHPVDDNHRTLSFLPLCHVFERMVNYHFQWIGVSIYYAENMGTIPNNLKEIKPHIFITVPRLLEKIYDKIITKGKELNYTKRKIFFWAIKIGLKYDYQAKFSLFYKWKLKLARELVFSKWSEALGGNVMLIITGGAALQSRLTRIFGAAGIPVVEGYGLTETAPVISVNNIMTKEIKVGTVGPSIPGVEVKIANDGEILCKGPNVMVGYFKEPGLTQEVIDSDGWFHTGDIGVVEDNKYIKITDRKKEIFKLSSGKYIAPQVIENKFKESVFIEQIMVIGENEKFASA